MIRADVLATASLRPRNQLTAADLLCRSSLHMTPQEVEAKTGIRSRGWFPEDLPLADAAADVCRVALARAGLTATDLKRLVFVCSTGGDFLIPATANSVLEQLGIEEGCDGFDLNNACMGFLSAFDVAARCVATGLSPVAVVVVEGLSRFLDPGTPRPYLVLADAAAAAVLGSSQNGGAVLSSVLGNNGRRKGTVYLGHPGLTRERELIQFTEANRDIAQFALDALEQSARNALQQASVGLGDIRWVVPHQPNGRILAHFVDRLGVPSERLVPVVGELGSVGAASMGVGLDELLRTRDVAAGDLVLLVGVGAGMSYGAMVYRVGAVGGAK